MKIEDAIIFLLADNMITKRFSEASVNAFEKAVVKLEAEREEHDE